MAATLADIQRKYGDGVEPLYKDEMHAPYMEGDNGIGYKGVILHDEMDDKLLCGECGNWYENLASHIKIHNLTGKEYKDKQGLFYNVPLTTKRISTIHSTSATQKNSRKYLKKGGKTINGGHARAIMKNLASKTQFLNKSGQCDIKTYPLHKGQIAARLLVIRDICKYKDITEITSKDVRKYDYKLYMNLNDKFKSIKDACDFLGIQSCKERFDETQQIGLLREFVKKNKRMPIGYKDCRGDSRSLPTQKVFVRTFGSWSRAKMMAGLDQLLEEVTRGKDLEFTIHLEKSKDL